MIFNPLDELALTDRVRKISGMEWGMLGNRGSGLGPGERGEGEIAADKYPAVWEADDVV